MSDYWDRQRALDASIPPMPRKEYLRKYPNGGPERFRGLTNSDRYREFRAAIKRRDKESRRPGWIKLWWALGLGAVLFTVLLITEGLAVAVFTILVLVMSYCFMQMMMNLSSR